MAEAREIDRTKIRRILEAGASGEAPPPTEPPTEEELLDSAG